MKAALAICAGLTLLSPRVARADGAMFGTFGHSVQEYQQVAFLDWDEATTTETLVVLPSFEGDPEAFAWVVPVPTTPQVAPADEALLSQLMDLTNPVHRHRDSSWDCETKYEGDGDAPAGPVEVVWHDLVDIYDVRVIQTENATAFTDSLSRWGFLHVDSIVAAAPLIADYVARGWSFATMTVDSTALAAAFPGRRPGESLYGSLRPIELTFATTSPVYPMRLSSLSAGYRTRIAIIVAADHRLALAGARTEYANRFDASEIAAVRRRQPLVAARLRAGRFLTYLEATLAATDMTEDLVLASAPEDDEYLPLEYGGFSTFGVFLAVSSAAWVAWKSRGWLRRHV